MDVWSNVRGVMGSLFGLGGPGAAGVKLKNNAGLAIEHRNAADSAFVLGRGADPIGNDDFVTKRVFDASFQLATGTITYPTNGSPLDTVLYTPSSRKLIQYVLFRAEVTLVGAGTETLRAGTTVGGNQVLVDQVIAAATVAGPAAGTVYGVDVGELGVSMLPNLGYALFLNGGSSLHARLTRTGVVTAGSLRYWVYGLGMV